MLAGAGSPADLGEGRPAGRRGAADGAENGAPPVRLADRNPELIQADPAELANHKRELTLNQGLIGALKLRSVQSGHEAALTLQQVIERAPRQFGNDLRLRTKAPLSWVAF